MKSRPILMSAPMVRALLAGTKTQTRRVVKLPHSNPLGEWQPSTLGPNLRTKDGSPFPDQVSIWHTRTGDSLLCPHGIPGDQLWVREAWRVSQAHDALPPRDIPADVTAEYLADGTGYFDGRYRHGRFMPRTRSRITLEITDLRAERLHDISDDDCLAEGVYKAGARWEVENLIATPFGPRDAYRALWDSINGSGSWALNPWIWALRFRRGAENIAEHAA